MLINGKSLVSGLVGTVLSATSLVISTSTIADIVAIITSIVGLLITILGVFVIPVIKWYAKAKKDGKIDIEEIDELADTLQEGIDKVNSKDKRKGE